MITHTKLYAYCSAYIIIGYIITHILYLPELVKSFFALPLLIVMPYIIGMFISDLFIKNQMNSRCDKNEIHVHNLSLDGKFNDFFQIDVVQSILMWILGYVAIISLSLALYAINLFDMNAYVIILISIIVIQTLKTCVTRSKKRDNIRFAVDLKKIVVMVYGLFLFAFLMYRSPFPLTMNLDSMRHNLIILNIINGNIVDFKPYLPSFHILLAIPSTIFNVEPISLFWSLIPLFYILFPLGIYLMCNNFVKNNLIAICASIIGVSALWSGSIRLSAIVPITIIYLFFPFYIYMISDTNPERHNAKKMILVIATISSILMAYFLYSLYAFNSIISPLDIYASIRARMIALVIVIIVVCIIIKYALSDKKSIQTAYVFAFSGIAALITHLPLGGILVILGSIYLCSEYIKLLITDFKYNTILASIAVIFMAIVFTHSNILDEIFITIYGVTGNWPESFNSIVQKETIAISAYSYIVIGLAILGTCISLIRKKSIILVTIIYGIFIIYFLNIPTIYRVIAFATPFISYFAAYALVESIFTMKIRNSFRVSFIFVIIGICALIPTYAYIDNAMDFGGIENNIVFFEDYEYKAASWIISNVDEDAIIISDPTTQLIVSSISGKFNIVEANNRPAIRAVHKMFVIDNPNEAYDLTNVIINNIIDNDAHNGYFYNLYGRLPSKNDKILIVISGRTNNWLFNPKDRHSTYLWQSSLFPGTFNQFEGIEKFNNVTYFSPIYIDDNIRIYEVNA